MISSRQKLFLCFFGISCLLVTVICGVIVEQNHNDHNELSDETKTALYIGIYGGLGLFVLTFGIICFASDSYVYPHSHEPFISVISSYTGELD